MSANFEFDVSRGVDVMRGKEVVAHFDGMDALEKACAFVAAGNGRFIRYWEQNSHGPFWALFIILRCLTSKFYLKLNLQFYKFFDIIILEKIKEFIL